MRLPLEYCALFGAPQYKMDTDIPERGQRKAPKVVRGLLQDIRMAKRTVLVQP